MQTGFNYLGLFASAAWLAAGCGSGSSTDGNAVSSSSTPSNSATSSSAPSGPSANPSGVVTPPGTPSSATMPVPAEPPPTEGSGENAAGGAGPNTPSAGGVPGQAGETNTAGSAGNMAGSAGNTAAGGTPGTGGAPGQAGETNTAGSAGNTAIGGSPGTIPDGWLPCDGDTTAYNVVVNGSGNSWSVEGGDQAAETVGSFAEALAAGFDRLSPGRSTKESMLVLGDGSIAADTRVSVPSFIVLNLCGTIDVTGTGSGDQSPIYARGQTDIDIPNARITGSPAYGMFFRETSNVHLGTIELAVSAGSSPGIGIRIDNSSNAGAGGEMVTNIQVDHLTVSGTASQGLETYGVDGLVVGRVDATDTGESGLLLNRTINAEVGVVHCENCGAGTGYAAFRIANDAGLIGSDWPAGNIHVGEVYARSGGRGIFSVSGSGGLTIDRIDIADTGNTAILLQNCYNTTIAAESGTITNGEVALSNDTANTDSGRYAASQNVTLQNLTLNNASVSEGWCELGDRGNRAINISGGDVEMCFN